MATRAALGMILALLLAACGSNGGQPATVLQERTVSTPVEALPVSISRQVMRELPTAVPEEIVIEADTVHLLLSNIYERSSPSVVNIEVVVAIGGQRSLLDLGRGSGFIYDRNGHIVTSAHIVNMADEIRVTFEDGYVTEAELIGTDIFSDLAVLSVDVPTTRLLPLELADSDLVRVGQRAIAIGNPFGLSSSMTVGIISGVGRQLRSAELIDGTVIPGFQNPRIIQVDTDINPGNSGGPLLNSYGQVIGVNTAIRTESGVFEGVGFAVPSNTVRRVIPELIDQGRVEYSWIGISTVASDDGLGVAALAEPLGLPVTAGVLVTGVSRNSPAEEAGLRGGTAWRTVRDREVCAGGDIIIAVDEVFIANMDELVAYLVVNTMPGDTIDLLVVRDDETFEVPLTLRARPTFGEDIRPPCGDEE
jgi:S1-C subfamily serine protease